MGDFNINLLNCNIDKNTSDYVDILNSHAFFPTINFPTQITPKSKTLTDNIFYNNVTKNVTSGDIAILISDHLTQVLLISNQSPSSKNQMLSTGEKRSFRNINSMAFEEDLKRINWNEALTLSEENVNSSFKAFLNVVERLIDKHCPKKNIPKTKCQTKSKPWITPALSNSIKIKSRVYKQFCKASDPIEKRKLHEWFKNYRSLTTILTRVCKEEYYNKKDSKKVWEGITSIIIVTDEKINTNHKFNNETITDGKVISKHFNKFFSSIAGKLVKKLPNITKTFDSYLNKQSEKSFFLSPVSPEDVEALISTLKVHKAV